MVRDSRPGRQRRAGGPAGRAHLHHRAARVRRRGGGRGQRADLVRSSLPHADVFVRLCDVDPGGTSWNVCDGLVGLSAADQVSAAAVRLWPTAYRLGPATGSGSRSPAVPSPGTRGTRGPASLAPPPSGWSRPTSPSTTTGSAARRSPSRSGRPGRGTRAARPADLPDRLALLRLERVLGPAGRPVSRQGHLVALAEPGLERGPDRLHRLPLPVREHVGPARPPRPASTASASRRGWLPGWGRCSQTTSTRRAAWRRGTRPGRTSPGRRGRARRPAAPRARSRWRAGPTRPRPAGASRWRDRDGQPRRPDIVSTSPGSPARPTARRCPRPSAPRSRS